MTKRDRKNDDRKVRASDFSMYQTAESRPTGLNSIFDSYHYDLPSSNPLGASLSTRSDGGSPPYDEASAEILKALDKLTKKDATTKLKALETLESCFSGAPDYLVESVMQDFMHVFKRLAVVEPVRTVRLRLGKVLCRIAETLKRRMQTHMATIVTHWFMAMHDDAQDVAAAYQDAFQSLFSTVPSAREERERKTFRVLTHYISKIENTSVAIISRDIESYKQDWLEVFGRSSDNSATISDIHNRLICSLLHSLTELMVYQRQYGKELFPEEHPIAVFLNSSFIAMIGSLCRSSSYKQRLASTRLMVEIVKVLQPDHLKLAKECFKIGMQRLYADEEASITYHDVRLVCACARYNPACWEPLVLENYTSLLNGIMDRYNGDFSATMELFTLFPCLAAYLPEEWIKSQIGVSSVLKVTEHMLELMEVRVKNNYESSFAFDAKLFGQLGSSMLCCYYRMLLMIEENCDNIVEQAFQPLVKLQCDENATAQYFLEQLPRIFTEFIEESVAFRSPEASDALLKLLRDMNRSQSNYLFMARIFAGINNESQSSPEDKATHAQLRSYAKNVEIQMKSQILNYELPGLLLQFIDEPSSVTCLRKLNDILSVVQDTTLTTIAPDSKIFEVHRFMKVKFADAWEFEKVFGVLSRAMVLYKPMLEEPFKYYSAESDPGALFLLCLFAFQHFESPDNVYDIAKRAYGANIDLSEGNNLAIVLKFIQTSQKFSQVLSPLMLSWLIKPSHMAAATCDAVYDSVDPVSLGNEDKLIYEVLHVSLQLVQKVPSKTYAMHYIGMVDDVVCLYLVGYYLNVQIRLEVLLRFCLGLLPYWSDYLASAGTEHIASFFELLQKQVESTTKSKTDAELYPIKEVVYALLAMQGSPCRTTLSISLTISALRPFPQVDESVMFARNATLFSHLWFVNCERYLLGATAVKDGSTTHSGTNFIGCFANVFLATFLNDGFNYQLFEKLADKLLERNICGATLSETLVAQLSSNHWKSKNELEEKIQLLNSYISKPNVAVKVMIDLLKERYTTNPFIGRFLGVLNLSEHASVTKADELLLIMKSCGDADAVSFINSIWELAILLDDAVCVSEGNYNLKNMSDCDYITVLMVELPLQVFDRFAVIKPTDITLTCWLHHALIVFFHSCINAMQAVGMDSRPFLNLIAKVWLMDVLQFCYMSDLSASAVAIELFSAIMSLCFSQELISLNGMQERCHMYDYSVESAKEYTEVIGALSRANLSLVLEAWSVDDSLDDIDPHYLLTMLVHMIERVESISDHAASEISIQRAMESLRMATYQFLSFCRKSKIPYTYSLCLLSRLWHCTFLLDNIAEYAGALCTSDMEKGKMLLALPPKFVSAVMDVSTQVSKVKGSVPVNVTQMFFNILQEPEEVTDVEAEGSEEEPTTPKAQQSDLMKLRGRKAISFYLNLALGPHMAENLFKIYRCENAESLDYKDLEVCLTTWQSVFTLLQHLKQCHNLTLANALVKALTVKPPDAGAAVFDILELDLAASMNVDAKNYVDAWWLETSAAVPENTEESVVHVFIQLLVLCLENIEPHGERYSNLVKTLYYKVSKTFPEEVNNVWNQCKNGYVKQYIMKFTKNEVTQRLIAEEMNVLKKSKSSALHISHDSDHRNIYASLDTKAEVAIKLTVKIPATFPLEPLSFVSSEDAGTFKNKHLRWLMMAQSAANRSGISQGLLLWSENITNFFEGIEECPICYSIVHLQFNTIPGKICKVCKHKFHAECLYKWFRNAPKAKCPLCQSHVSFTSYN